MRTLCKPGCILCMLSLVFAPMLSWAASFNCQKAFGRIEKTICGNPQLSRLDEELASAYRQAANLPEKNAEPLVADQRRWLKSQRNKCADTPCLTKAYERRIAELKVWDEAVAPDRAIFGNYELTSDNLTGNMEPVKTTDCLTLRKSRGNAISYSFSHVGMNYHMCGMEGEAVLKGEVYESTVDIPDADPPRACTIRIHFTRRAIFLEDVGAMCREYFCGARASISNVGFLRDGKVRKECKVDPD
jgi:uncharacterized protein